MTVKFPFWKRRIVFGGIALVAIVAAALLHHADLSGWRLLVGLAALMMVMDTIIGRVRRD
jgi:hypothetical protein